MTATVKLVSRPRSSSPGCQSRYERVASGVRLVPTRRTVMNNVVSDSISISLRRGMMCSEKTAIDGWSA